MAIQQNGSPQWVAASADDPDLRKTTRRERDEESSDPSEKGGTREFTSEQAQNEGRKAGQASRTPGREETDSASDTSDRDRE